MGEFTYSERVEINKPSVDDASEEYQDLLRQVLFQNINFVRVVVISDFHCGHRTGLTPPGFVSKLSSDDPFYKERVELWNIYADLIEQVSPIDVLIINGDLIEGKGYRSGGTELISGDRIVQVEMACKCIEYIDPTPDHIYITYGTPYHSGRSEDWEKEVAVRVGADEISDRLFLSINDTILDVRHFIPNSTVPHTRGTSVSRDKLWNILWAERGQQPKADILIRSHVHAYVACEDMLGVSIITPALQGIGTKFGARKCSNVVDFGILCIDIYNEPLMDYCKKYTYAALIAVPDSQIIKPTIVR